MGYKKEGKQNYKSLLKLNTERDIVDAETCVKMRPVKKVLKLLLF